MMRALILLVFLVGCGPELEPEPQTKLMQLKIECPGDGPQHAPDAGTF